MKPAFHFTVCMDCSMSVSYPKPQVTRMFLMSTLLLSKDVPSFMHYLTGDQNPLVGDIADDGERGSLCGDVIEPP